LIYYFLPPFFPVFLRFLPLGEAGEEGSVGGEPFLIAFFLPGLFG